MLTKKKCTSAHATNEQSINQIANIRGAKRTIQQVRRIHL